MEWVIQANAQSKEILQPTITIFIDVDPDTAVERIAKIGSIRNYLKNQD